MRPRVFLNEEQLLKKPLLHACILLDSMEKEMQVTEGMKELLREECYAALDELRKSELAIIEQKKQSITNNNNKPKLGLVIHK